MTSAMRSLASAAVSGFQARSRASSFSTKASTRNSFLSSYVIPRKRATSWPSYWLRRLNLRPQAIPQALRRRIQRDGPLAQRDDVGSGIKGRIVADIGRKDFSGAGIRGGGAGGERVSGGNVRAQ